MITLYIEDEHKDVANTVEEITEFFISAGGKEVKKASDPQAENLITAKDENGNSFFFEFPEAKMKKVVRTIMPSLTKKKKGVEEEFEDE